MHGCINNLKNWFHFDGNVAVNFDETDCSRPAGINSLPIIKQGFP